MSNAIVLEKPAMIIVGIECRTSNAADRGPHDIPMLWDRFTKEGVFLKIPNRASDEVIALYYDYESDHTQSYTFVIGCKVNSFGDIPEGMVYKIIPGGSYALYRAVGDYPASLIDTWGEIWGSALNRSYTGDYELYGEKFQVGVPKEVEVMIALKTEESPDKLKAVSENNKAKFEAVKQLNFPIGHYMICGSGPLGIRNLRPVRDIDIAVTNDLWNRLKETYPVIQEQNYKRLIISKDLIEVIGEFGQCSPYYSENAGGFDAVEERIARAEVIDDLPFEALEDVIYFKKIMCREKDLNDIFTLQKLVKAR